ncbi:unnamed protein product [Heterobilharzia americana]|nr:unnamed protein product [Heterobilharzia americana]
MSTEVHCVWDLLSPLLNGENGRDVLKVLLANVLRVSLKVLCNLYFAFCILDDQKVFTQLSVHNAQVLSQLKSYLLHLRCIRLLLHESVM